MSGRILYLHGFASGPGSKKAQFFRERFVRAGVDLEIPDLTEGDFEGLTITGQLAVVERLAGGEPVSLMGSSMGGYLAALYAARHPEARRLVLMAPAFALPGRWAAWLDLRQMENWKRTGRLPLFHYGEQRERSVGYQLYQDAQRYEDFPAVTQPALIFHGLHDTPVPPALSQEFVRLRANARLRLMDSDHELLDVVEEMWEATRAFLALPA